MKLYIVRHGITPWNALKKVQGTADIPLAEEGVRLARLTGEALREVPFDLCFTSPLIRARQTAELILGERDIPMIPDKRIQEIDFGVLEGVQFKDEEGNLINEEMKTFFLHPEAYSRPEQGEDIADICRRTRDFWIEKTSDSSLQDKTILVTTHGCAARALLQNVYQDDLGFWHGKVPPNCAVNLVEIREGNAVLLEDDKVYA